MSKQKLEKLFWSNKA